MAEGEMGAAARADPGSSVSSAISELRSSSAQTPVALTMFAPRTSNCPPLSVSTRQTPSARPSRIEKPVTSTRLAHTAPKRSASPSTVSTRRTSSVWQS